MVAKKTTTPQWGNPPDANWSRPPEPGATDDLEIPEFLKRDKDEVSTQAELEEAIAATKPDEPEQPHPDPEQPPHDPETGELVEPQPGWSEQADQMDAAAAAVENDTSGSETAESGTELPDPAPKGGDGRELRSDDNSRPKTVVDDDAGTVGGAQLFAFVERIERLEEERKTIGDDIKEVYAEMKGNGFDTATVRRLVALRKLDPDSRRERESLLDLYKTAIGMA